MAPLESAFIEGIAQFEAKYGCKPEAAYVSPIVQKALFRLFHTTGRVPKTSTHMEYMGLPLYQLRSPYFEVHLTKIRIGMSGQQERMVQRMRIMPRALPPVVGEQPVVLENYEYDSEEEFEWLTQQEESDEKDRLRKEKLKKALGIEQ